MTTTIHPVAPSQIALERAAVLAEARTWVGTPFHHNARVKGAGVDCAQFLMACYVDLGMVASFDPGFYSPDWFVHESSDRFRAWVARWCTETADPVPGDLVLFRYGRSESHGAIVNDRDQVIHSYRGSGVVVEDCGPGTPLSTHLSSRWVLRRWATDDRSVAP